MYNNVIEFYIMANNLKKVVRTGWVEVGIPNEKVESVADHIYGTLILSLAIISEKKLDVDVEKIFKMILIKELYKGVSNKEESIISSNKADNKKELVERVLSKLATSGELLSIYDEYDSQKTKEAKFAKQVCKLESDIQAKIYEKNGDFTIENAKEDIKNYPEDVKSQITEIKHASDGWLIFDRAYYYDDFFMNFSKEIEEME
ncbi:MAG: HD domain-containing protein [Bacilli bacterium]|nr:HD domain-containing protein [Bacilli bacterium]